MSDCAGPRDPAPLAFEDAIDQARTLVRPVTDGERIGLSDALGRILAEPVRARIPLPPFDNAAVDGYALASGQLIGRVPPFDFPVIGRIIAGTPPTGSSSADGAMRIFTGAAMPTGYDAVVMQEYCERRGDRVIIGAMPDPGANVRYRGEDVPEGEAILKPGTRLDARHITLATAVGTTEIVVQRRLRAAIFTTGNELRVPEPNKPLPPAAIYDSNRPMLQALLTMAGVDVTDGGTVGDDLARLAAAIGEAAPHHDLILTTGGVSVGDEDYVVGVMATTCRRHLPIHMALKPGKPAALALTEKAVWLGLPGNGFAALVVFLVLGRPILRTLMGLHGEQDGFGNPAVAAFTWTRKTGRDEIFPVRQCGFDGEGRLRLEKLGPGGAARLKPLADADGLALVRADVATVADGTPLTYLAFNQTWCL